MRKRRFFIMIFFVVVLSLAASGLIFLANRNPEISFTNLTNDVVHLIVVKGNYVISHKVLVNKKVSFNNAAEIIGVRVKIKEALSSLCIGWM